MNKNEWLYEKNLNQNSSYKMSALVKVIAWEWCNARETEIRGYCDQSNDKWGVTDSRCTHSHKFIPQTESIWRM